MSRKHIVEPGFSGVAAGQTATVDLSPIGKYHQLRLAYSSSAGNARATMEGHIAEMRVRVNGKTQRTMSAAQLFAINAYHGVAATDGFLPIIFSEPWRRTVLGEDALAWGMGDVDTFQLEVDFAAGGYTPSLSMTSIKEPSSVAMGPIVKWKRFNVPVAGTGVHTHPSYPKNDAYYAIHAFSGDIDDVEVKIDGEDQFDGLLADVNEYYAQNGFTGQAGLFHVDFAATGRAADALPMVNADGQRVSELRVDFNMNAANAFDTITETLGVRD